MTNAEVVAAVGRRVWGTDWPPMMAACCDVNLRTLQRIRAAAEAGSDYGAAPGVIAALREALPGFIGALCEALEAVQKADQFSRT
jgi:hypothetical protein